jgi:uncharacterized protein YndB with AHSA1/START domain
MADIVTTPAAETTLFMRRTFAVSVQSMFDAWTRPEILKKWFSTGDDYSTPVAEIDFRVGGRYRIAMRHIAKGVVHTATGIYREIVPRQKLVFTWRWEEEPGAAETLVTVEMRDLGGSTELSLKHELFPNKAHRDNHEKGWFGCLDQLARTVARSDTAPPP